jgi:cation-transporting ATPase 13A3/4/5
MAAVPNGQHDVETGIGKERFKLALTGNTWSIIRNSFPELVPRICTRGAVFARMSADQKQQLVQELQGLGYYVGQFGRRYNHGFRRAIPARHVGKP